jgi:hypothetical protein
MLSGVDVRVGLLGPLRLLVDGTDVKVRPMRRALLALAEGRSVTVGHLLDALYPTEIPVHLETVGVAAGKRVADQGADGVGEGVGVGGSGAQRLA